MFINISSLTFTYVVCQDNIVGTATTLRVVRSGDRNLVGMKLGGPFQTGPETQPAYCTMDTWPHFQG